MTALVVLRAGPACTLQDAGRRGYLRYGVTPAGPMDWIAHATANMLAGNTAGTGAVEIGPGGLAVVAEGGPLRVGLVARGFRVARDGVPLAARLSLRLDPGARLEITPGAAGMWGYLAVGGGFDVAPVLGSLSTHLRSGIGPCGALSAGQRLAVRAGAAGQGDRGQGDWGLYDPDPPDPGPIRFVPGPQVDRFAPDALEAEFRVTPRCDRMAYRLQGPPVVARGGHDIVSDGIAAGAIQVPGDGMPFVLMADRQPTGGYAKPGTVIRADLPRLAQLRPGAVVRFAAVDVETAVAALRAATPEAPALHRRLRALRMWPGPGG